jgi:hypothetical protein
MILLKTNLKKKTKFLIKQILREKNSAKQKKIEIKRIRNKFDI